MTINKKFSTGLVTACAAMALSVSSVFASVDVNVSGNGNKSDNTVKIETNCKSVVSQSNVTEALTEVNSVANTGNVKANGNTGGMTEVVTGDAASQVKVTVTGGDNTATAPSCCECAQGDVKVDVKENGNKTDNEVKLKNNNLTKTLQSSLLSALTGVDSKAKTGGVKTKWNTGTGTSVLTGSALSKVKVSVMGGYNTVNP